VRIVDAHFHVWRQADLPWLAGPMQPRIFGPYEPIRRDYPMAEYLADLDGAGVEKAVYVQANWAPDRAEAEVRWVEDVARETGWPHAIVGYADLTVADARPALDRLARYPRVRGVRQQLHWHDNPLYSFAQRPDLCLDENMQRNVARLADYGWTFDLQVFAPQMEGACTLADAAPRTTLVLQHAGMLEDLSDGGTAEWRAAMRALAQRPNAVAKLSGLGTFIHRNDPAHISWIVSETVPLFGADRCLFGSNFPIEKLWTDCTSLVAAHAQAAGGLSASEREAVFHETARRVYRL
jgi:predicted TIM-barrel fold metal-dependent hydrolase